MSGAEKYTRIILAIYINDFTSSVPIHHGFPGEPVNCMETRHLGECRISVGDYIISLKLMFARSRERIVFSLEN